MASAATAMEASLGPDRSDVSLADRRQIVWSSVIGTTVE